MLNVHQLSIAIGARELFREVSFVLNPGDRVGLVGPNGSGKSTLMRVLAGLDPPTSGSVALQKSATLAYLPQGWTADEDVSTGDVLREGVPGLRKAYADLRAFERQLEVASSDHFEPLAEQYGEALARFEHLGGYALESRAAEILSGLGLADVSMDVSLSRLSGGQRTRVGLARILIRHPDLLLLDEPTNHLGIGALEWLEGFLGAFRGALLVVSHDRLFLNRTVNRILAVDEPGARLQHYIGSYSDYEVAVASAHDKQIAAFQDQQSEIARLKKDAAQKKRHAQATESKTTHDFYRARAKKVAKKGKAVERRLERYLQRDDLVDRPEQPWRLKVEFPQTARSGDIVLSMNRVVHRYTDSWLFHADRLELRHGDRVAVIGPNGCGKSTLLNIISGTVTPTRGKIRLGSNTRVGYLHQHSTPAHPETTPVEVIRGVTRMSETDARSFLHHFLFTGDDVLTQIKHLSAGEQVRLSLAALVVSGSNFLLLDEPMNHLDIPSRERLETTLFEFPGTILVVGHDRAFIDRFPSGIWAFQPSGEGFEVRPYLDRKEMARYTERTGLFQA